MSRIARGLAVVVVAAGLVILPAVPAGAAPNRPGLSITGVSPGSGPVGTKVTITGSGFTVGDVVQFNGTTAKIASVNAAGTTIVTAVPPLATTGPVMVSDPAGGGQLGPVFTITTGIWASPHKVWAGGPLLLAGSGMAPDNLDPVKIGPYSAGTARVDSNGNFVMDVTAPWGLTSGIEKVTVTQPSSVITTIILVLGAWPMYRHDPQHTGVDNFETALSVSTVQTLHQVWQATTNGGTYDLLPSVADGLVFAGINFPESGQVNPLTTNGKKIAWIQGYPQNKVGPEVAISNGQLYLTVATSINPTIRSLNATTGVGNWGVGLNMVSSLFPSAPNVVGTTMYFGAPDGTLEAADIGTGNGLWSFQTGGAVYSSPAVDKGLVFAGSDGGTFYAVHAGTGKKAWSYGPLGAIDSSPAVVNGTVYVGSDDGSVIALNETTGAVVWHRTFAGADFATSPAVANGIVYIGGGPPSTGHLYALDAATGKTIWTFTTNPGVSDPAYANGLIFFTDFSTGTLRALDASNGNVWAKLSGYPSPSAPIVSNGQVYVNSQGNIFAFGL
jgi:outer membrane protein assembly factor BamB